MSIQALDRYVFIQEGKDFCISLVDSEAGCLDNKCKYRLCVCWHFRKINGVYETPIKGDCCVNCMSGHHDICECKGDNFHWRGATPSNTDSVKYEGSI